VSDLRSRPLRHALKQAAVTGTAGSLLLGAAVAGLAAPASTAVAAPLTGTVTAQGGSAALGATRATTTATATTVSLHATAVAASTRRVVDRNRVIRVAASLKGRPYRYGAAGPWAFDCSGYVQYVLKQQHWRMNRTAAGQYRQTRHISRAAARPGDLVFFYGSGGIYHVGIFAGHGKMWAAPHTGAVVRLQKIYGNNWVIGRIV
jgi:cell wall-associated NlpC family hydrolase